ncbi:hypothetical protein LCGC14_1996130 [marine sediment metagenome]|uniref:Uncharacterized protein n=1 Tax=marine sediment metagenome TaxID=412755 RepID=A0A0F9F4V8_9ZZZZ
MQKKYSKCNLYQVQKKLYDSLQKPDSVYYGLGTCGKLNPFAAKLYRAMFKDVEISQMEEWCMAHHEKRTVIGSREEGESVSSNKNTHAQQIRFDQEWERMYAYCKSVSGVDAIGLINDYSTNDTSNEAVKGGLYYYCRVERNKKHVYEFVYLVPVRWGIVGNRNEWFDDDGVVYDYPESKDGIGQTLGKDEIILVRNGVKTRMSGQKYDAMVKEGKI